MELMDAILTRRAVRKYKSTMPNKADIDTVIKAGLYAPSGKGMQSPIIIAVTNKALRDKLSAINCEIGGWDKTFDPFYGAPVVLLVVVPKKFPNGIYDGTLVMENMMLAARSLGLGTCWIHRAKQLMEREEGKAILQQLGINEECEGIGHCILGYPEGDLNPAAERKTNRVYYID